MKVAVVGLGAIGSILVTHLLKSEHEVLVWNRSPEPVARAVAAGAAPVASVAEAFQADVVVSVLFGDESVRERLLDEALLRQARPGLLHVCMATISPDMSTELAAAHHRRGVRYVAAPFFGRVEAAEAAQLQILVAGEAAAAQEAATLLGLFGRTWAMGEEPRHANLGKLSGNFLIGCAIQAMAEASAVLSANGADDAMFIDMMSQTLLAAPIYRSYGPSVVKGAPSVPASLSLPPKDIGMMVAAGQASHLDPAFGKVLLGRIQAARDQGLEEAWGGALGKVARQAKPFG